MVFVLRTAGSRFSALATAGVCVIAEAVEFFAEFAFAAELRLTESCGACALLGFDARTGRTQSVQVGPDLEREDALTELICSYYRPDMQETY